MITVLTGGSGGAKFAQGLMQVVSPRDLTFIVNTADDLVWWGLRVSPDVDSIMYALAGMLDKERGWGVEADTFHCLDVMRRLGAPAWFQIGDRDLATHLARTELLGAGKSLTEVTAGLASTLHVESRILPMTDSQVSTRVFTAEGELSFQEYFVKERWQVPVEAVGFEGAADAHPAPGVVDAIMQAEAVLVAPSNPITSIGPILAITEIRNALAATAAPIGAISPIVGGAAVSGPAGTLMATQGLPVSIVGVAKAYSDFLDVLIADHRDVGDAPEVEQLGTKVHCTRTIMKSDLDKAALGDAALRAVRPAKKREHAGAQPA